MSKIKTTITVKDAQYTPLLNKAVLKIEVEVENAHIHDVLNVRNAEGLAFALAKASKKFYKSLRK